MSSFTITDQERDEFLRAPRLAILMYQGPRSSPTGVPVWYDWHDNELHMFAARNSAKIKWLRENPNVSVLMTSRVGEPEGWVAFDGVASISEFTKNSWRELLDRVAPRYRDMKRKDAVETITQWKEAPEAFHSLSLKPLSIRSGR